MASTRFDRKVYIAPPDHAGREAILKLHLGKMPHEDVDISDLAMKCEGFSGAEIVAVCREGRR